MTLTNRKELSFSDGWRKTQINTICFLVFPLFCDWLTDKFYQILNWFFSALSGSNYKAVRNGIDFSLVLLNPFFDLWQLPIKWRWKAGEVWEEPRSSRLRVLISQTFGTCCHFYSQLSEWKNNEMHFLIIIDTIPNTNLYEFYAIIIVLFSYWFK